jgi:hypothetical protein
MKCWPAKSMFILRCNPDLLFSGSRNTTVNLSFILQCYIHINLIVMPVGIDGNLQIKRLLQITCGNR